MPHPYYLLIRGGVILIEAHVLIYSGCVTMRKRYLKIVSCLEFFNLIVSIFQKAKKNTLPSWAEGSSLVTMIVTRIG